MSMGRPKKEREPLPTIWEASDEMWAMIEPILAEHDPVRAQWTVDKFFWLSARAFAALTGLISMESLAKAIGDGAWGDDKRSDLLTNIGEYKVSGATGEIAFDQYGDSTNKLLTVYQVSGKDWKAVETGKL